MGLITDKLFSCLSIVLVVNVTFSGAHDSHRLLTFDIGLHVGGGRTYGRPIDYQNFSHVQVTIFFLILPTKLSRAWSSLARESSAMETGHCMAN